MKVQTMVDEAKTLIQELMEHRRWLHQHAETGFSLTDTNTYVTGVLRSLGIKPERKGKMGISAEIAGRKPGKTFLLRADMDALPICEESGDAFACTTGAMHACGHDLHTAMLLGAAKLLLHHKADYTGTVRLMFQPAEETLQGAKDMIDNGILDGVDRAMMLHVIPALPFPVGTPLIPQPGIGAPSADYFTVTIEGKGCHGATPHKGIDPIIPAAHIILDLQEIIAREIASREQATLTVGAVHAGDAGNVIPDKAELSGTARTYGQQIQEQLKARIADIATQIGRAYRTEVQVSFTGGCPPFCNAEELCKDVKNYLSPLLAGITIPAGTGGESEDFAWVSQQIPSIVVGLAAGEPNKGYTMPLHHPKVRFDEAVLPIGSAILAGFAMDWLNRAD